MTQPRAKTTAMPALQEPRDLNSARKSFKFVIDKEVGNKPNGGYTVDPDDPGGETKWGIAKKYHPNVDIKNLTPDGALAIYLNEYWYPSGADDLPYPACLVVMDTAIQCGVSRAKRWLKETLNISEFVAERRRFHLSVAAKELWARKYIGGWMNRCTDLDRIIEQEKKGA